MTRTIHSARITGPVSYLGRGGRSRQIPFGPCLIEQEDGQKVDIVWGANGQNSVALPIATMISAEQGGHLVLLD